jgi:hypothetical protein
MIAQVVGRGSNTTSAFTPPANWDFIRHDNYAATTDTGSSLFWKIADADDVAASDFTFTATGATSNRGTITAWYYSGGISINASEGQANVASITVTSDGLTPSVADCMICLFCAIADDNTQSSYAIANDNPASWTEAYDLNSDLTYDLGLSVGYARRLETSATGNGTATTSGSDANVGQLVAIAPVSVATPTVTISAASSVEETTATLNGNVTATGGQNPTVTVYWGDNDGGTTIGNWDNSHAPTSPSQPQGVAAFYYNATSLSKGTLYYFSAKATNTGGTDWPPASLTFLTKPDPPSSFTATANGGSQIDLSWTKGDGADYTYIRGKLGSAPTSRTDGAYSWNGTGVSTSHTGLSNGQHWYYIAWSYCTDGGLTQYSDTPDASADTTTSSVVPAITTGAASSIDMTSATISESCTSTGGTDVTDWGTYYGLTNEYGSSEDNEGTHSEPFDWDDGLTGLAAATVYHYQGYATNSEGTGVGIDATFMTLPAAPTDFNPSVGNEQVSFSWTKAIGGSGTTVYTMVRYQEDEYPSDYTDGSLGIDWTTGASGTVASLANDTLYYFAAFSKAVNGALTQYSTDSAQDTATPLDVPVVNTGTSSDVQISSATVAATCTDIGGSNVTSWGFYYGKTTAYGSTVTNNGTQTEGFNWSNSLSGLQGGTIYHYQAFATNSEGTGVGGDAMFSTASSTPSVSTTGASAIAPTSAYVQGELTSLGNYTYASVSFEYGVDDSYGMSTSEQQVTSVGAFTAQLTGLYYSYTYHFRAVARFVDTYYYGADSTFTTLPAAGSSYILRVFNGAVFSDYMEDGDLLFVAEINNTYTGLYPNQRPGQYFSVQLIATDGTTVLGATPLQQWGDRPSSIYFNADAVSTFLTPLSQYYIRVVGTNSTSAEYQLETADWKGSDLTALDYWCVGCANNMAVSDGVSLSTYVNPASGRGNVITDEATAYFLLGIPGVGQMRPNLFETSQQDAELTPGSEDNAWDSSTAWRTWVGDNIADDIDTMAIPFGLGGKDLLSVLIGAVVIGCAFVVVGGTGGMGALGATLIAVPLLWLGTYAKILPIMILMGMVLFFGMLAIRQFVVKTL